MKTKLSLLSALVALAGAATVQAQTVYSLNIVGYANVVVPPGFSMICNPLQAGTNTVAAVLNVPNGTSIYKYNSGTGQFVANNYFFGWTDPNMTLLPGEGIFINNQGTQYTNTFVGEVLLGALTNAVPNGFAILSSKVPQQGLVATDLGYPAVNGDTIYKFNAQTQQYVAYNYFFGWAPSEPTINVGESFFSYKQTGATNWVRTFNPNSP